MASLTGLAAALQAVDGNKAELARRIGKTRAAITQWGKTIPVMRVLAVEEATGVSREILRPDIFGPAPKKRRA
jgi:DNA-binding transcriptional regulator YdaS (Cro superfamily)